RARRRPGQAALPLPQRLVRRAHRRPARRPPAAPAAARRRGGARRGRVRDRGRGVSAVAARDRSLRAQRKALVSAMLVFSVLLVLLQLWLLTATVNAVLDGDASMALPAA